MSKAKFNALYGMCVTNNIRDLVEFDNINWYETPLTNEQIIKALEDEKKKGFLAYSWGVWVTAYARNNLLENLIQLDEYLIYADTDSLKLKEGFDENVILNYNKNVKEKIKKVCSELDLDINQFEPEDTFHVKHCLGVFDLDAKYKEFKTMGAKKYAYIDLEDKIHITVSGVPKSGAKALKKLEEFDNDFVFKYEDTGKLMLSYNDEQPKFNLTDFNGKSLKLKDKYGICLVPTTYKLGMSEEYMELTTQNSSKHAIFKE